jgi:hypothetical protein
VDELSEMVSRIGAANNVVVTPGGKLVGENTDLGAGATACTAPVISDMNPCRHYDDVMEFEGAPAGRRLVSLSGLTPQETARRIDLALFKGQTLSVIGMPPEDVERVFETCLDIAKRHYLAEPLIKFDEHRLDDSDEARAKALNDFCSTNAVTTRRLRDYPLPDTKGA